MSVNFDPKNISDPTKDPWFNLTEKKEAAKAKQASGRLRGGTDMLTPGATILGKHFVNPNLGAVTVPVKTILGG